MSELPNTNAENAPEDPVVERVDLLVSALLDEVITEVEVKELETLLRDNADARARYVDDMMLHSELTNYFSEKPADKRSPVLGFLAASDESGIFPATGTPTD